MATLKLNGSLLTELQRRQRRALEAAALFYLKLIGQTLSNGPARTGREYDWYKGQTAPGHLWPMDRDVRFFTRFGKVHPIEEPAGGWKVRGRIHKASAPGEPPALLTGDLRRRRGYRIGGSANGDLVAEVGSSVPYAARLEYGGGGIASLLGLSKGGGIAARPSWRVVMRVAWDQILATFAGAFRRGA